MHPPTRIGTRIVTCSASASASASAAASLGLSLLSIVLGLLLVVVVGMMGIIDVRYGATHVNAAGVTGPESYPNRYRGNSEKHIVVIGTGPTGLGAAWRLYELGYTNWTLVEATKLSGGLAKSQTDANGFTWDHGVHVLFSHYEYFDSMLDYVLPESEWFHHSRYSPAWMRQRFVDYPVQNNVWQLPKQDTLTCLAGLSEAARLRGSRPPPKNFDEWVVQGFGEGLADIFMRPYNFKVWAHPTPELNVQWVGERVATIDINVILKHMIYELPDRQWGPNARFRYPARGSGQIWQSLFSLLPRSHIALGKRVVAVETSDPNHKRLVFEDKTALTYDAVMSTIPIDILVTQMVDQPEIQAMSEFGFKHQTVNLVGIGIEGPVPTHLNATYWVYFPEEDFVFYRLTVLSNFSPYMVPKPGEQYSILVEVSESKYRKVNHDTLVDDVIKGLILSRFVSPTANIIDRWQERFEYGYPVPYVGRDEHVHTADEALRKHGIWSRGRFGAWKYEVANQDHSFMLGVEAIDNILFGTEEVTYHKPDVVNAGKGKGRHINPPNKKHKEHAKAVKAEALDVSSAPQFYTVDASLMEQVSSRIAPVYVESPALTEQEQEPEQVQSHTRQQVQSHPHTPSHDDHHQHHPIMQDQPEPEPEPEPQPEPEPEPESKFINRDIPSGKNNKNKNYHHLHHSTPISVSDPLVSSSSSSSSSSLSILSWYRFLSLCVICALGYLVMLRMRAIKVVPHEKQRTPTQTPTTKLTKTRIQTLNDTPKQDNSA